MALGAGGAQEEPRLGGKLPAGLFGFLRLRSRALSPVVGLGDNLRATQIDPSVPVPSFRRRSRRHPSQAGSCPQNPRARAGDREEFCPHPSPRWRARTCPSTEWGSLLCSRGSYWERRWQRAAIQRGGGRCFPFPAFALSSHPTPSKRATCPGQSEGGGREWGGGVGSGLCPDTCLPRRPGPAGVWREGGSPAPRPAQPPRIKGRLRRGETSGRPGGGGGEPGSGAGEGQRRGC